MYLHSIGGRVLLASYKSSAFIFIKKHPLMMKSDQCLVLMKQRWSTSRSYHPSWMSHSDCSYNTIHYTDGDEVELDVVRKSTRWGHTRDILRGPVLSKTSQKVPLFSTLFKAGWLLLQVLRFLLLVRPHLLKRLMAGFTIVRHCTILHCNAS